MPKLQYINSPERDFSQGIDARSAENQIDPGYVKSILNADIVGKRIRKRRGSQGYAGNLPFRVTRMEYKDATNEVCFTLDSSVSLETVRSSPIVVYGRSSSFTSGDGPFTDSDSVKYYDEFTVPLRKELLAPSGTLNIPGDEHGLDTYNLFVSVLESLSVSDRSYTRVLTDSIAIDEAGFDINIDYSTYVDRNVFAIFADRDTATGSSYVHAALSVGTGSQSISIPASTHALSNFNIITQVYQDTGATRLQVEVDSFTIANNGDVTVVLTNGTGSNQDYYILLSAAPVSNVVTGSVGADASGTVSISGLTSPWIFYGIYLETTPGGDKELVYADSIDYDDSTGTATLSFSNQASNSRNFIIFYEYGSLRSNQLCITDSSVTTSGIDETPQISIWGLEHSEVYASKSARESWATHVDSYRRSGEQRLISGLGGNLFSAREYSEAATQYAYPLLYPNLAARTSTPQILAPLFWDTGETPARTRGYITSDVTALHFATISAVEYDSGNGWTKYTISLPSKAIVDSSGTPTSLGSVISVASSLEDWLTVQGMSWARHNGTFRIRQLLDGSNEIYLWVENDVNTEDYDDSGTAGSGAILTDQFTWTLNSPFIADDVLISDSLNSSVICTILSSTGMVSVSDGIVDRLEIAAGVLFNGNRISSVIPMRTSYPSAVESVEDVVRGDLLSYTEIVRELRVLRVNPDTDRSVDIAVSSGTATVTLLSGSTSSLAIGQKILLLQAGVYSGVQTIVDITGADTLTFDTDEVDTVTSATLVGNTIQVDEELNWSDTAGDTKLFTCERRWIPIEAPDDSYDLTPSTHIRYFDMDDYSDQPFLRSTMVVDTLYPTNGDDEVYKFDGTNMYRSGIIPWQPGLFLTQDTSGARIVTSLRSLSYSAVVAGEGKLTITAANTNTIPAGSSVRLSGSTQTYTVSNYSDDGTNYYILMDRALDSGVSATGTVAEIGTWRYYFRLNAVDANSNIIASAVTGYQDHVVELTQDAAILLKLIGLPAWDVYAYNRLECEIYRTKVNQAGPFYKITTQRMSFNNTEGYLLYRDSFSDIDLNDLDKVNTALKGSELGTAWSDALRSKYVTSIGNKLVLAHLRDYPQLDLQIVAPASTVNSDFAGDSLLFRRDNTDTGTTTDMLNRVRYEWVNGSTGTASGHTVGTDDFTFTTSSAHGAAAGDWIYLTYATVATSGRDLTYSGWWQIASAPTTTSLTVNLVGAAAATTYPNRYVTATNPTDVPVLLGVDGNMGMVNGDSFDIFDAMRRMSMAVNVSMRQTDISLTGYETFTPWLIARGGNDVSQAGRLLVRQPRADSLTPEVVPTFSGYDLFVNSVKRSTGDQISASTRIYPSRILASYENYPEIFDNPTSILDTDSDSAIDINSADGQEITGIIPFFGEAAFTAAQQAAILVVFKTNSIYLVDLNQKALGNQAVQRIETEGLGCTAPYSIAVTKKGINFANESGMYCLRRDQSIEYVGKFMERNWTEQVDLQSLAIAHGTHYGTGRCYKLSVPLLTSVSTTGYVEPSEVYVYNHTAEDQGKLGAWGRYDNHLAIGWANLASNAYYASTSGRVYILRNTGLLQDFRDDNSSVNMVLQVRPSDFENGGIRKIIDAVIVHYRVGATSAGTELAYSVDLEEDYTPATSATLTKPSTSDGVSDTINRSVITVSHSVGRRRCVYFSIQLSNNIIDESVEIAGIDYRVAGLNAKGIVNAAET